MEDRREDLQARVEALEAQISVLQAEMEEVQRLSVSFGEAATRILQRPRAAAPGPEKASRNGASKALQAARNATKRRRRG